MAFIRGVTSKRARHLLLASALLIVAGCSKTSTTPWLDTSLAPEERTKLLLAAMTVDEKIQQMVGQPGPVAELPHCLGGRHVPGLPRLKIPTLRITNGPVGIGQNDCVPADTKGGAGKWLMSDLSAKATALPSAMTVAASFDRSVATEFGDILGRESRNMALHVMEGPGINMARMPHAGRNFEYFGEDPFLTGTMGVAEIIAIQKQGVIAMPKHIVANDQETDRKKADIIVDDRVLHQIYLLPFEMAVKEGDVASFMCSYNFVNGTQMCENKHILTDVLRGQWGFKGYIQSDFFAVQSLNALRAGMDHEMPGLGVIPKGMIVPDMETWYRPDSLKEGLAEGKITQADIDQALTRRYVQMFRMGIFDRPVAQSEVDIKGNGAIAQKLGEQGAVLLKNANALLPLDAKQLRTVAIIGKADYASKSVVGGGGSSQVIPHYTVSPLDGMRKTLAGLGSTAQVNLIIVKDDNSNLAEAVAAARAADVAIVMAGTLATEGKDLPNISLPLKQDAMVDAVAAANARTVLVLKNNASVLTPWIDKVPAVMETWYPGQEDGNIVARLLLGLVNPSGKLPVTYPRREADLAAINPSQFPGTKQGERRHVPYSEGLAIGYRWFNAKRIAPQFPFGYGLSYTSFALSGGSVKSRSSDGSTPFQVTLTVENTGKREGAEVAQVYLGFPEGSGEPPKRLVGFEKVHLKPGEKRQVTITVDPAAASHPFGVFDAKSQSWKVMRGTYRVMVGNSSENITMAGDVTIG